MLSVEQSYTLWTIPLDLKLVIASQDYTVFRILRDMFVDVNLYFKKMSKILSIQLDKFTTKNQIKDEYGKRIEYRINGKLHREGDLPAIIGTNGRQEWYKNGKRHRDADLPAIMYDGCMRYWYKYGKKHRENGPAIIYSNGKQVWYKNGHRVRLPNQ